MGGEKKRDEGGASEVAEAGRDGERERGRDTRAAAQSR